MKKTLIFFLCCLPVMAFGADDNIKTKNPDFKTVEEILATAHQNTNTECSNRIFSQALQDNAHNVSESDSEQTVRAWVMNTIFQPDVLEQVLECPEITSVNETSTVYFAPIIYDFPGGRNLTINYNATPKALKQRLLLSAKPSIPNGNPNPRLMDPNDPAKYMSTDPAWYGILVVQHGSLDNFVGPDKNNTVSLKYLEENINHIYPSGAFCTNKSAIAMDGHTINKVVKEVIALDEDSNDYYIAGDVNLEWIMYAEIAADIILTIATAGTGEAAVMSLKGIRATKNAKKLAKGISNTRKLAREGKLVRTAKYIKDSEDIARKTSKLSKIEKNIEHAKQYEKTLEKIEKAKRSGKDVSKYEQELKQILENAKKVDPDITEDSLKSAEKLSDQAKSLSEDLAKSQEKIEKMIEENQKLLKQKKDALKNATDPQTINKLEEEIKDLESMDNYIDSTKAFKEIQKYRHGLEAIRRPQTGNVITRTFRSLRYAGKGVDVMDDANKTVRAGLSSRSAKVKEWLFDKTLKHGTRLARFERDAGVLAATAEFVFDLYDKTSSTSQEFSNGIEFKPLCLLSADNLEGQDNVVNYGMWLMWTGDATDPSADDAAFLQAMDFASKFSYTLNEYQKENGYNCNVDIYVVRPIIRIDETDTNNPTGEMFYLFMNEIPWTGAK